MFCFFPTNPPLQLWAAGIPSSRPAEAVTGSFMLQNPEIIFHINITAPAGPSRANHNGVVGVGVVLCPAPGRGRDPGALAACGGGRRGGGRPAGCHPATRSGVMGDVELSWGLRETHCPGKVPNRAFSLLKAHTSFFPSLGTVKFREVPLTPLISTL